MAETIWALLELNRNAEDPGAGAMALHRRHLCIHARHRAARQPAPALEAERFRRHRGTDDNLAEALRLQIHDDDPSKVEVVYMERSGHISVIPRRT